MGAASSSEDGHTDRCGCPQMLAQSLYILNTRSSNNLGICTGQSCLYSSKGSNSISCSCCFRVFCPRLQSRTHRYSTSQDEAEIKLSLDMHLHKDHKAHICMCTLQISCSPTCN